MCHESCEENGTIIESAAGWAGRCQLVRANGALLRANFSDAVTIEKVRDSWSKITNMNDVKHMGSIHEATAALVESLEQTTSGKTEDSSKDSTDLFEFNDRKYLLYALGGKFK